MNIRDFFYWHRVKRNLVLIGLAGVLGLFIGVEIGLNVWIRGALETGLLGQSKTSEVHSAISWMGLRDFLKGRVGWVRVDARNCRIGTFDYQQVKIDNNGFIFNLPVLIKERRLSVLSVNRTFVQAAISAQSLQNYLNNFYAQYQPRIIINPKRIQLTGIVKIFGSSVPVQLVGDLRLSGPKRLHFYPSGLRLGNRPVSGGLLQFVGTQIPLEFSVLEDWPLHVTDFSLQNGYLTVSMREDQAPNWRTVTWIIVSTTRGKL